MAARRTCSKSSVGWPNGLASFLASTRKSPGNPFRGYRPSHARPTSCISLANRLLKQTSVDLSWVVKQCGKISAMTNSNSVFCLLYSQWVMSANSKTRMIFIGLLLMRRKARGLVTGHTVKRILMTY